MRKRTFQITTILISFVNEIIFVKTSRLVLRNIGLAENWMRVYNVVQQILPLAVAQRPVSLLFNLIFHRIKWNEIKQINNYLCSIFVDNTFLWTVFVLVVIGFIWEICNICGWRHNILWRHDVVMWRHYILYSFKHRELEKKMYIRMYLDINIDREPPSDFHIRRCPYLPLGWGGGAFLPRA